MVLALLVTVQALGNITHRPKPGISPPYFIPPLFVLLWVSKETFLIHNIYRFVVMVY
jgi:hypothetical protein